MYTKRETNKEKKKKKKKRPFCIFFGMCGLSGWMDDAVFYFLFVSFRFFFDFFPTQCDTLRTKATTKSYGFDCVSSH